MKLNEFKKAKLNELDLSSFLGDYGSAAVKSGLGSLMGKNTLSTTDQMAKDQYIKSFISRAASGLESAINSGLVNPAASNGMSGKNIGTNMGRNPAVNPAQTANPAVTQPVAGRNVSPTPAQNRGVANKAGANAFGQMANQLTTANKSPEQIRKEKQAAATGVAQKQMAQNGPFSKLPANQAAVQAGNIRQQKQAQAATAAQGQMAPVSKLPADQFNKSAANVRQAQQGQAATAAQGQMTPKVAGPTPKTPEQIRQAKQLAATQAAQGQLAPASKLPADQFNKSADKVRQQHQTTATQTAQQQMATPQGYKSSDPRFPNGKYDGVTGEPTPEYQAELDKWASDSAKKQKADAAASQGQAKSNDEVQAQQNPALVAQEPTTTASPNNVSFQPGADAVKAKLDAMKQKNPKLAAQMAALGMDDEFNDRLDNKPDNTVQMPKRNKNPKGKVAESRFDKLNYIFESIIAEATMAQTVAPAGKIVGQANQQQSKQSISQYITNYFKQFMKGVNISDPSVMTNVASLAKQLEQTYAKDKGKSILPKLADLGWSVSHAQAEQQPRSSQSANTQGTNTSTTGATPQSPQASSQQAKMTTAQIKKLMQGLNKRQKQSILQSLEAELNATPTTTQVSKPKAPTKTTSSNTTKMPKISGAKQGGPTPEEEAKLQQRIQQAAAQQK